MIETAELPLSANTDDQIEKVRRYVAASVPRPDVTTVLNMLGIGNEEPIAHNNRDAYGVMRYGS